jgi:hypothetical protein
MDSSERTLFNLLDEYARTRHSCFLAEFFMNSQKTEYILCFRPLTAANNNSPDRYAYEYLRIEADVARAAGKAAALVPSITGVLDNALAALNDSQ